MRFQGVNPGEHPEYVVVGLGNPGQRYENTRHNVGFKVIDYLDEKSTAGCGVRRMLHSSLTDKCVLDGYIIFLVKPQTFMNNSGMAVRAVLDYYKMTPEQLIVIYDDVSLPVGHVRIRKNGSAGGHNGMKSIIQHIGTSEFIRIKVGVGHKPEGWDLANYVLGKIPDEDYKLISKKFELIKDAVSCIMNYGIEKAMSYYNGPGSM